MPTTKVKRGEKLIDVVVRSGLAKSKSEARRLMKQGGITLNGVKIHDVEYVLK